MGPHQRGPTLYVSAGTVYGHAKRFFDTMAEAFAGTEWFVVMATAHTDPASLDTLPYNVVARRYVPQSALRRVRHARRDELRPGGLSVGVPMVLVPQALDQRLIARRIAELGAGVLLALCRDAVN